MRTLRLYGLMLAVLAIHLAGWRMAAAGLPDLLSAPAGVHWMALVPGDGRGIDGTAAVDTAKRPAPAAAGATAWAMTEAGAGAEATPDADTAPAPPRDTGTAAHAPSHETKARPEPAVDAAPVAAGVAPSSRLRVGTDGNARSPPDAAATWPVYATRPPPSATLRYTLREPGAHPTPDDAQGLPGEAEIDWTHDDTGYSLRLAAAPAGRAAREWLSVGAFDAAGVAPVRLTEREKGRDKRAINFDRALQRVRFSGASLSLPLAAGAQDRWSWVVQLAAIAEAASVQGGAVSSADTWPLRGSRSRQPRPPPAGTTWQMQVAGLRGELDRWAFRVLPDHDLPPEAHAERNVALIHAGRAPALLHVVREPERPYDLRIEAWLSPSLHHLPIGLRMSAPPGSWSLALWPKAGTGAATGPRPSETGARPRDAEASGT